MGWPESKFHRSLTLVGEQAKLEALRYSVAIWKPSELFGDIDTSQVDPEIESKRALDVAERIRNQIDSGAVQSTERLERKRGERQSV